jgi:hypothetical protein
VPEGTGADAVGSGGLADLDTDEEEVFVPVIGVDDTAGEGSFATSKSLPLLDDACTAGEIISSSTLACLDAGVDRVQASLGTSTPSKCMPFDFVLLLCFWSTLAFASTKACLMLSSLRSSLSTSDSDSMKV